MDPWTSCRSRAGEFFVSLVFLLSALSASTAFADPVTEDRAFRAANDGTEQRYVLVLPDGFDPSKPVSVLIALHGHGSDRWQFVKQPRDECRAVRDVAAAHGMLLVSPDYRAATSWMGPKAEEDLVQIIGMLKRRWLISRVILSGGSMGGTGALTFTALHPELIDGCVSLNGTADLVRYDKFQDAIAASFGGSKADVPDEYRRRSAVFFPERFTMPLGSTTGGRDTLVPPQSVLQLMEKVGEKNPHTVSVHRPEGGHSSTYEDSLWALEFVQERAVERLKPLPRYPSHTDLSSFVSEGGQLQKIQSRDDWLKRREHVLASMRHVMGPPLDPRLDVPLDVKMLDEQMTDGIVRRKLSFQSDRSDRVTAWLMFPPSSVGSDAKRPAMLCLHQTTGAGKDEPAGLTGSANMHYALELTKRGYITLSPDYPSLGEHAYDFDRHAEFASGTMKAIHDNRRAVDLLQTLPEVDAARIGVIGHSLGGHNAIFSAAFDERLKVIVSSCGFSSLQRDDVPSWNGPRYMPLIASVYANDANRLPFDFPEILAALAPRPVFINAPLRDSDFDAEGVKQSVTAARSIYQLFEKPDALQVESPDSPHDFPPEVRQHAYEFLDRILYP